MVMIAAVAAMVAGATGAFFSDTETSAVNTYTAGTIDISVDGQNPWNKAWSNYLDKPCQTNYMNFVIKNEGENPARVWKKLTDVVNGPGAAIYPDSQNGPASSEPEYYDGLVNGNYVERDNLSAFMIYDMAICVKGGDATCKFLADDGYNNADKKPDMNTGWTVLIDENDQVRVDNVVDTWIELIGDLQPEEELYVSQSYHLMTWDDSGQPMVTNWAQGDTMEFVVELEARQIDAPAPGTAMQDNKVVSSVEFIKKDATSWEEIGVSLGTLSYEVSAETFNYDIDVNGLVDGQEYSLIYYADPYPGNNPGKLIKTYTATGGIINDTASIELGMDLPDAADANSGVGAKLWIVLASDYSGTGMTAWNPTQYLFDKGLVNYDDTQI